MLIQFLLSIGDKGRFNINLEDEVVRRSIITHRGEVMWPAPAPAVAAAPAPAVPARPVRTYNLAAAFYL
jgi:NAD(P) transhydrogenase